MRTPGFEARRPIRRAPTRSRLIAEATKRSEVHPSRFSRLLRLCAHHPRHGLPHRTLLPLQSTDHALLILLWWVAPSRIAYVDPHPLFDDLVAALNRPNRSLP